MRFWKKLTYFLFFESGDKTGNKKKNSKNGFRRTKTGQKAVHWAHLTYEVTINVKECDFRKKNDRIPVF